MRTKSPNLTAHATDVAVGRRIRERRVLLGLTQQQLADLIGVTYQQAHKYERGINRVSAGRLAEFARVLSVPVAFFFAGADNGILSEDGPDRQMLELGRNFARLGSDQREVVASLVRTMAASAA